MRCLDPKRRGIGPREHELITVPSHARVAAVPVTRHARHRRWRRAPPGSLDTSNLIRGVRTRQLDPADDRRAIIEELDVDTSARSSRIDANRRPECPAVVVRKGDECMASLILNGEPCDGHLATDSTDRRA